MRVFIFLLFIIVFSTSGGAQNARFSQISSAPITLNPALTGRGDGGADISVLSSWQNSKTTTITHQYFQIQFKSDLKRVADNKLVLIDSVTKKGNKKLKKVQGYWAGGIYYYQYGNDLTGITQNTTPIKASFVSGSVARHMYVPGNEKHYFGFGGSITFASGKVKEEQGIIFDKEVSGGGFTYRTRPGNLRTGEKQYFDFNLGLYYGYKQEKAFYEVGFAVSHWHYPENSFFNDAESKLRHRGSAHVLFGRSLNKKFNIIQKNVFWAEGLYYKSRASYDSAQILSMWNGIELRQKFSDKKLRFDYAFYSRSFRTLMPMVTVHLGRTFDVRLSHEWPINSSSFTAYSAVRTELFLSYVIGRRLMRSENIGDKYLDW
ncbi:MAG: hypothetical protein KGZ74_15825 [Chitinophagaceae bacterium]|nr:hypothetical protein [Chitinophagaceae bacterium]